MKLGALSAVLAALMLATTAHADRTSHDRVKVDGFAVAFFGCPGFFNTAGTVCRETHVEMFP